VLKILKPDKNGVFPIINEKLDNKVIVVVDEYDNRRQRNSYFLLDNESKVLYIIPSMDIISVHVDLCQNKLHDYQNLFRILGSKCKPDTATTYFMIFDNEYEYTDWLITNLDGRR